MRAWRRLRVEGFVGNDRGQTPQASIIDIVDDSFFRIRTHVDRLPG